MTSSCAIPGPHHHRGRSALPSQLGLHPRSPTGRGRDPPAHPGRGSSGHLPSAAGPPRRRSDRSALRPVAPDHATPDRYPEEIGGCEDARLTSLPELEDWVNPLHRLQSPRADGVARPAPGLHRGRTEGTGHAARGQGGGCLPAPVRRPLGDDPPPISGRRQRAHLDLLLSAPRPLGGPPGTLVVGAAGAVLTGSTVPASDPLQLPASPA